MRRGRDLALEPDLATDWAQAAPLVWRFHLRRSVRFQDGSPFSADDVVFSFIRATSENSKLGLVLSAIQSVRKVDAYTVDIVTNLPDPILPQEIASWDIMSKAWCEQNDSDLARRPRRRPEQLRRRPRQWHRSVFGFGARARRGYRAGAVSRLVGQATA